MAQSLNKGYFLKVNRIKGSLKLMLKLYDLSGKNDLRFSPPCWNVKLCLILNNIEFLTIPVRFTDKDKIAFSKKKFILNLEQDTNPLPIKKSVELVYGIRNFIGNANKFAKNTIYVSIITNSENSEIIIEDDGLGFPKEILNKIGEPYLKTLDKKLSSKAGLGLGIFIGKTLLEKNLAKLTLRNSLTRSGAEVKIMWANRDLINI